MATNPLDPGHLFDHVQDADYFEFPRKLGKTLFGAEDGKVKLPQPLATDRPLFEANTGIPLIDDNIEPFELRLTKFMVLEVVVALIICVVFIRLASKMSGEPRPRG